MLALYLALLVLLFAEPSLCCQFMAKVAKVHFEGHSKLSIERMTIHNSHTFFVLRRSQKPFFSEKVKMTKNLESFVYLCTSSISFHLPSLSSSFSIFCFFPPQTKIALKRVTTWVESGLYSPIIWR